MARERAGLTITGLAARAGVSVVAVVKAEEPGTELPPARMEAIAEALDLAVPDLFDHDPWIDSDVVPTGAPLPSRLSWPPPAQQAQMVIWAYRCAGDAVGAAELLGGGTHEATVRAHLNRAGCAPRPRGGSRADGVMSLGAWVRKQFGDMVTIREAVDEANRGRVPGAFLEPLECPVLRVRWAVRAER